MLIAADNLHGLNAVVAKAMEQLDPTPLREMVKRFEQNGADCVDINPGYLSPRKEDRITFLVDVVQKACSLRIILDSPSPRVLKRGVLACDKPPILNALSLETNKISELLPLAVESHADLIILLMDETSYSPAKIEEKISLAIELRHKAMAAGMAPDRLVFDPVLPSLRWDDSLPRISECVKTVRLLSSGAVFQETARTMVGLSNLRSGFRSFFPAQLEYNCLGLLAGAGIDMVLADILDPTLRDFIASIRTLC